MGSPGRATTNVAPRCWRCHTAIVALGAAVLGAALAADPSDAAAAVRRDWPAFALVTGLLLIGVAAHDDGLFEVVGRRVLGRGGRARRFVVAALAMGVATAVLNLDTAAAFVTPVLLYGADGAEGEAMCCMGILLANGASLFLPGSNLTNLIVVGGSAGGAGFLARTWPVALTAFGVTAAACGWLVRRAPRIPSRRREDVGLSGVAGVVAVAAGALLLVWLRAPAVAVLVVGVAVTVLHAWTGKSSPTRALGAVGLDVLAALFAVAVALGTLGRAWSWPHRELLHAGVLTSAAAAAATSVVVNNLPAASLLASRPLPSPLPVLLGLDLGPNLFFTGSLAWFVWWRAVRAAGRTPPTWLAVRVGAVAACASLLACAAVLMSTTPR